MKSPFAIIRKHQKIMMVITIGLCMFAFIFLGSIEQSGGQGMLPILGVMMGAGVFWVLGNQAGKAGSYTVLGAILGLLLGLLIPRLNTTSAEVATSVRDFSGRELQQLINNRHNANKFMSSAYAETHKMPDDPNLSGIFAQLWQRGHQMAQFQLTSQKPDEDVIIGYLLRHEAERMGITVSDEYVIEHIQQITTPSALFGQDEGPLSKAEFKDIRANLGLSETELFDILRDELQAQIALSLLVPATPQIPEQSWQDYRKVHVRQSIEIAALNVDTFAGELEEPTESELQAFFEQHKANFPGQTGPGAPGFRQPRKVQLAFLEADYETVEGEVPDITEEEITAYYEENKDVLYRVQTIPDPEFPDIPITPFGDKSKSDASKTPGPKLLDPNEATKPTNEDAKKDEAEQPSKKPAEKPEVEAPAKRDTEKKTSDTERKKSDTDKKKSDTDKKSGTKKEGPTTAGDKPAAGKDAKDNDDAQAALRDSAELLALATLPNDSVILATAVVGADEDKQDADKSEKKKAEVKPPADGKAKQEKPSTKADSQSKDEKPSTEAKENPKPESKLESAPPFPKLPSSDQPPPPPLPQPKIPKATYRPLSEAHDDIRDDLLRERTGELLKQKSASALAEMRNLGLFVNAIPGDPEKLSPETVSERLQAFAKANGLRYVETKLLSYQDLQTEDYPIGKSVEPVDDPFQPQASDTVSDQIFRSTSAQMYAPQESDDRFVTDNRFVWWVIDEWWVPDESGEEKKIEIEPLFEKGAFIDQAFSNWELLKERNRPHARTSKEFVTELALSEWKTIREQVIVQWKTNHARPKAQARAKELADLVGMAKEFETTMSETLDNQTVTGNEDALPLTVLATPPFSWYTPTAPSTPQMGLFQQRNEPSIRLSSIPNVDKIGNKFMESVYKLDVGDVEVIPNFDLSTYYVVRLMERIPTDEANKLVMQYKFLSEGFSSQPNRDLASDHRSLAFTDWYQEFQQKYDIRWKRSREN